MSRFKCAYISCGRSTRKSPGIRTFTFPVKDQVRCEQWIINSGNADLIALSPDTLRRCFICEKHFKSGDILSKKLSSSAIPIKYDVGSDETKTYGQIAVSKDIYENPLPSTSTTLDAILSIKEETSLSESEIRSLTELPDLPSPERNQPEDIEKQNLKRKLADTENEVEHLRSMLKKQKNISIVPRDLKGLPYFPRALTTMQLYHKAGSPWSIQEKNVAISLFYKSPTTYKFLRNMGVILPSPSTISKWLEEDKYMPGFNKNNISYIKVEN